MSQRARGQERYSHSEMRPKWPWLCCIYLVSLGGPLSRAHGQAAHGGGGGADEGRLGGLPKDWSWRVSTKGVLM